jgi:hypothetical protein
LLFLMLFRGIDGNEETDENNGGKKCIIHAANN